MYHDDNNKFSGVTVIKTEHIVKCSVYGEVNPKVETNLDDSFFQVGE